MMFYNGLKGGHNMTKNEKENLIISDGYEVKKKAIKTSDYMYVPDMLFDMDLSSTACLIYAFILRSIMYGYKSCNNAYIAEKLHLTRRSVSERLKELEEKGAVIIEVVNNYERYITPIVYPKFMVDSRGDVPFSADDANSYFKMKKLAREHNQIESEKNKGKELIEELF